MRSDMARPGLRVAFAGGFSARLADRVRTHLKIPCTITLVGEQGSLPELSDVDVLVTLAFTHMMGAVAKQLKLVQVPGAGLDQIDRSALPPGTWLANAYGHEIAIAEYVIGAMLAWSRGFCRLDASLRRGNWESPWAVSTVPPPLWPELSDKTLGILGYGRIGQCLAQRAQAFGMAIWAIRRDTAQSGAHGLAFLGGPDALDEVLRRADYLAITLSLTEATRGLLGEREFQLMKSNAVLVNVARAEIVEEEALYRALTQKTIAGAVLDVWYRYPTDVRPTLPARHAFHELPNVLMTPHVSGWTEGMLEARAKLIAENIHRVARGERPVNLILPSA
jgi:phosphoglycerate dehydrogenase-like enzyme